MSEQGNHLLHVLHVICPYWVQKILLYPNKFRKVCKAAQQILIEKQVKMCLHPKLSIYNDEDYDNDNVPDELDLLSLIQFNSFTLNYSKCFHQVIISFYCQESKREDQIVSTILSNLEHFSRLQDIKLAFSEVEEEFMILLEEKLKILQKNEQYGGLQRLTLDEFAVPSCANLSLRSIFETCGPSLVSLSISDCGLRGRIKLLTETLSFFTSITEFTMSCEELTNDECEELLNGLVSCKRLKTLSLHGVMGKGEIMETNFFETMFPQLPSLSTLNLSYNHFSERTIQSLGDALHETSTILHLEMGNTNLSDQTLNSFKTPRCLRSLNLSCNSRIRRQGMFSLFFTLDCLHFLQELNLSHIEIGKAGACLLSASFASIPELRDLSLNYSKIGDDGLFRIANNLSKLQLLEKLEVCGCRVKSRSIARVIKEVLHTQTLCQLESGLGRNKFIFLCCSNQLADSDCFEIVSAMYHFKNLNVGNLSIELDLNENEIEVEGADHLATALSEISFFKRFKLTTDSV